MPGRRGTPRPHCCAANKRTQQARNEGGGRGKTPERVHRTLPASKDVADAGTMRTATSISHTYGSKFAPVSSKYSRRAGPAPRFSTIWVLGGGRGAPTHTRHRADSRGHVLVWAAEAHGRKEGAVGRQTRTRGRGRGPTHARLQTEGARHGRTLQTVQREERRQELVTECNLRNGAG